MAKDFAGGDDLPQIVDKVVVSILKGDVDKAAYIVERAARRFAHI